MMDPETYWKSLAGLVITALVGYWIDGYPLAILSVLVIATASLEAKK